MKAEGPTQPGWLPCEWPAPPNVRAGTSTRQGGVSAGPYAELNLALHVGDDVRSVTRNRELLRGCLGLPGEPAWLEQEHGNRAVHINKESGRRADAAYTDSAGSICAVLSADCIPLLLCDTGGTEVAAVHVGWRGLCAGVALSALALFRQAPGKLLAWIGPHISAPAYVVGEDVRAACLGAVPGGDRAFTPAAAPGRWHADLAELLRLQIASRGVASVHASRHCTSRDAALFHSHRRSAPCGRMASLIWLESRRNPGPATL